MTPTCRRADATSGEGSMVDVGQQTPDLTLYGEGNKEVKRSDYRG
ncbi:MAG TPA: hypothetical protein VFW96_19680 [Thermomicrobiales bacterium]|nr:hypothetical protein [Thermomicrobiales bacterium]